MSGTPLAMLMDVVMQPGQDLARGVLMKPSRLALITGFQEAQTIVLPTYSVAVYQPHWLPQVPKLNTFDIRGPDGWIRPRDFIGTPDPLQGYSQALLDLYASRKDLIADELSTLPLTNVLCCWCPHDKAAKRQLEEWGSYVCHTAIIGKILVEWFGWQVFYGSERNRMVKF